MTRTMPLWGAVLSLVLGWGSASYAQQANPVSAAGDTLTTTGEQKPATAEPGAGPTAMQDTTTMITVRHTGERMKYYVSLGVGSAYNYLPDGFHDSYNPAFGLRVGGGIAKYNLRLGVTFSYNFFFSNGPTTLYPDDLNILTAFADLRYVPVGHTVRPYVLVCGGYFRTWIVNEDFVEGVLGYGGGAGIELEIDKLRHLFLEGRYVQGQTRVQSEQAANTEMIPVTLGLTWIF